MKIDIHSHFFPVITRDEIAKSAVENLPWLAINDSEETGSIMLDERVFRPVHKTIWDPVARIKDLDFHGIDIQIVCATPILFGYTLERSHAEAWCRKINNAAVGYCSYAPHRLKSLAQIPIQHMDISIAEINHAKQAGHIGIQIGTHVGDCDLYREGLLKILVHCANVGMPVLIHPWDMPQNPRLNNWMMQWLVGMPAETQTSILSLALSGSFERLPHSLKICFAHGGGSFPYLLGRADNAWKHRDMVRKDSSHPPGYYIDRFYVDSAVFSSEALHYLVSVMGSNRIMLGSDQPFPLGEQSVGKLVSETFSDNQEVRDAILGRNACEFFGLSKPYNDEKQTIR